MPAKPISSPTTRLGVGSSSGKAIRTTASVLSGVAPLMIPARIELTCVSPYEKRMNGTTFIRAAITKRCRQVDAVRGNRVRLTVAIATRAIAPIRQRPKATWIGFSPSRPTLMKKNEQPQIPARMMKATCQGSRRPATAVIGGDSPAGWALISLGWNTHPVRSVAFGVKETDPHA